MLLIIVCVLWGSPTPLATKSGPGRTASSTPAQATPDFLPAARNKRHALLFPVSRDFPLRIGYRAIDSNRCGCFSAIGCKSAAKRVASVRPETEVRLDDDILRGAFGLTAEKKPKTAGKGKAGSAGGGTPAARGSDPHISNALRSAYEEAVKEDVPAEFLDLLGKLS